MNKQMTIKQVVFALNEQMTSHGINDWLKAIEQTFDADHRDIALDCADHFNLIEVNHSASFDKIFN